MQVMVPLVRFYRRNEGIGKGDFVFLKYSIATLKKMTGERLVFFSLAARMEEQMKRWSPVRTGRLRKSIRVVVRMTARTTTFMLIFEHYGMYQEFGTELISPRPFVRPALYVNDGAIKKLGGQIVFRREGI
jgi:HK97 gp10 family phage protein